MKPRPDIMYPGIDGRRLTNGWEKSNDLGAIRNTDGEFGGFLGMGLSACGELWLPLSCRRWSHDLNRVCGSSR